jgi:hypothetical protein
MDTIEFIPIIQNYHLMYAKYDITILEQNIDRLSLRNLLKTQTLTPVFCRTYLLHPEEYGMCVEDHSISRDDILLYQPHITMEQLNQCLKTHTAYTIEE